MCECVCVCVRVRATACQEGCVHRFAVVLGKLIFHKSQESREMSVCVCVCVRV